MKIFLIILEVAFIVFVIFFISLIAIMQVDINKRINRLEYEPRYNKSRVDFLTERYLDVRQVNGYIIKHLREKELKK